MPQPANLTTAYTAIWDAWNRLISLARGGTAVQQNVYDGLTRRVQQITSGTTRQYYYSAQWQSLEERLGASTTPDRQFTWGLRYIDDCVLRDRSVSGGTLNERLYALQDANWNVDAIVNTSGTVQERYAYTAYGVPLFLSASFTPLSGNASAFAWETLRCGYRYEVSVEMYCVRYRWLSPLLGSWLSRDPLKKRKDLNPLRYVRNRPVGRVDAYGLDDHHWMPRLNKTAQAKYVNPLCCDKGIPVNIDDFTTSLPGGITGRKGDRARSAHSAVEYVAGYGIIGRAIYRTSVDCCQMLVSFRAAMTVTWDLLTTLNAWGRIDPELGPFRVHPFHDPKGDNTLPRWDELIKAACAGDKNRKPSDEVQKLLKKIEQRIPALRIELQGPEPGIKSDPVFFLLTVGAFAGIFSGVSGSLEASGGGFTAPEGEAVVEGGTAIGGEAALEVGAEAAHPAIGSIEEILEPAMSR